MLLSSVIVYSYATYSDQSLKPIKVGLNQLESAKKGTYKVAARIVDINEETFTISNDEINIEIRGRLTDKKLSDLYTQKEKLFGEIQVTKSNGNYNLVSIKRYEGHLYVVNKTDIKGKLILNTKGVIGTFK